MSTSKFHISLNVHDLKASTTFLELLLDTKPTQSHSNYVKFELADPALVLSLIPTDVPSGNGINHLGFKLPNRAALDALQERLRRVGVAQDIEESVACCYSKQSKAWVHDKAGNLWEFYAIEDSASCESKLVGAPTVADVQKQPEAAIENSWGHRLGTPIPQSIPAENGSLDKVILEGTFNARLTDGEIDSILTEASRALRPGGTLIVHGLTADRALSSPPKLPGPAAKVEHVPTHHKLIEILKRVGFVGIQLVTFGESYTFAHAGAELRETKLEATRRGLSSNDDHIAIYRGPFAELRDDSGQVFRRGEEVRIDGDTCRRLQNCSWGDQFVFSSTKGGMLQ